MKSDQDVMDNIKAAIAHGDQINAYFKYAQLGDRVWDKVANIEGHIHQITTDINYPIYVKFDFYLKDSTYSWHGQEYIDGDQNLFFVKDKPKDLMSQSVKAQALLDASKKLEQAAAAQCIADGADRMIKMLEAQENMSLTSTRPVDMSKKDEKIDTLIKLLEQAHETLKRFDVNFIDEEKEMMKAINSLLPEKLPVKHFVEVWLNVYKEGIGEVVHKTQKEADIGALKTIPYRLACVKLSGMYEL